MIKRLLLFFYMLSAMYVYAQQPSPIKKYNPVFLKSGLTYTPKPVSFDSEKVSNYISVGYVNIKEPSTFNNSDDAINIVNFALSRGHVFDKWNFAYGIDAFFGSYKNKFLPATDPNYFSSRAVSGVQFKTSLNLLKTAKALDFRYIGLDLSYANEFGEFSRFRKTIIGREKFYSIPKSGLFTAGLSSEIVFKGKFPDNQFGFRFAVQNTFGDLKYQGSYDTEYEILEEKSVTVSGATYLKLKQYFLIFEIGNATRINIGYKF